MVHCARQMPRAYRAQATFPRFEIHADRGPQSLARIVGAFAAQNLVPADLHARQSCGGLWIGLAVDMPADRAERMAEKLRALVCVAGVILISMPADQEAAATSAALRTEIEDGPVLALHQSSA